MNTALHTHTPTLVAIDPRGLEIRHIGFCRSQSDQPADERVTRQKHDPAGRLISQRDPRLAHPNLDTIYSLSGQALLTDSVDAGWRLALLGEAGQAVASWDSRDTQRQIEYDSLLRPVSIVEQTLCSERLAYGGPDVFEHNQCNQLIRHDDTAGTLLWSDYSVIGSALTESRDFFKALDTPDWPLTETERDALLENNSLQTQWAFNALGEAIEQTDAMGNVQHSRQTVAGQLKTVELTLAGTAQPQTLVRDIRYNAFNQVEQETAGNGVVSHSRYDPQDGRLMELSAALQGSPALQHLVYSYDPVGNILQIEDRAQPVRFFANRRIEPVSRYTYDTLYQLIEATGREVNTGASHGPALPGLQPLPPDINQVSNYTQSYSYDAAGNLLQLRHVSAQSFTRTMRVAPDSNRSLPEGEVEADFNEAFDANGNLLHLTRGQTLEWDIRNQLQLITTVTRPTKASDHERYIYGSQGQRCRKINSTQTSSRTLDNEVRYLPGLEIRTTADGEVLHVITSQNTRVLHWQTGQPSGIENDQIRYSLSDHLGSSTLELDQQGGLISLESYYPFGGTSWWAARSAVDAKYKTIRYSGKERDASGLYYYGFRYYAPGMQCWISADPAQDGLNKYMFVLNNPIGHIDVGGLVAIPLDIFIQDIINPLNPSIGTGEFEELTWSRTNSTFTVTDHVYGRGMEVINGAHPEWELTDFASAFAIFRDDTDHLRLFVNNYQQHMGIQPGMGLPETAGLIRRDPVVPQVVKFDNRSGHYKPPSSIDVSALLKELTHEGAPVTYDPFPGFATAEDLKRINTLHSPESYADIVKEFRAAPNELIPYLKTNNLWEEVRLNTQKHYSYNVLGIMDAEGMSREDASRKIALEEASTRQNQATTIRRAPVAPPPHTAQMSRPNTVARPQKRTFWGALFRRK